MKTKKRGKYQKMKTKRVKTRLMLLNIKVSQSTLAALKRMARKNTNGNLSEWLRARGTSTRAWTVKTQ